jgi:hypothetical protein
MLETFYPFRYHNVSSNNTTLYLLIGDQYLLKETNWLAHVITREI